MISRRQLAAYGISMAELARLAKVPYARTAYYLAGGENLDESERARIDKIVLIAVGNQRRLEEAFDSVPAGSAVTG
jgi:hypothetical protein